MRLERKVAIVTGAAKGIGAATRGGLLARWGWADILVNNAGDFAVIPATEDITGATLDVYGGQVMA